MKKVIEDTVHELVQQRNKLNIAISALKPLLEKRQQRVVLPPKTDERLTAGQAAIHFGVTKATIYNRIHAGQLSARKRKGRWSVDPVT